MDEEQEGAFDSFLSDVDNKDAKVEASKRKPFKLFSGSSKDKKKVKKKNSDSSFYEEALDFAVADDDDFYGVANTEQTNDNEREDARLTLQTLFEFRWWELGVLIIELLLVVYLILVLTKVVPLF